MRILFLWLAIAGAPFFATETPEAQITALISKAPGHVSFFAKNLDTGASFGRAPDEPVRTASTIKLPIIIECFSEAEAGKLNWTEPLTVAEAEKVGGAGVVAELSDGVQLPIRDLMHLMIVVSDNTATNLILNRITGDAVNVRMAALGLQQTRSMRKILKGDDAQPSGISKEGSRPENKRWGIGRSSPREMVALLERLYRGELVSAQASKEMLEILKRQQDRGDIARNLPDLTVAHKTGALDHLRSDVGIVYTKYGAIAMAITVDDIPDTNWSLDNPGQLTISKLSELLIEQLRPIK